LGTIQRKDMLVKNKKVREALKRLKKVYHERVKPQQDAYEAKQQQEILDKMQEFWGPISEQLSAEQEAMWNRLTKEQQEANMKANMEAFEEMAPCREEANCKGLGWHTNNGEGICKYCGTQL
jgi:hypothetical protein